MKDKAKDSKALLIAELLTRSAKQKQTEVERERDEFRRRLGLEETD